VIVRLDADGAVVADADDCSAVHLETGLDRDRLKTALHATGTGSLVDDDDGGRERTLAVLDLAVLRSRARLLAHAPDWTERFDTLVAESGGRLTDDGLGLRVPIERP
jgi:hypothetical protein